MNSVPEYLAEYANKIAIDEGFVEHTLQYYECESKKRENYVANIVGVTIAGQVADMKEKSLHLVCKLEDKERRADYSSILLFEREAYMYNKIFPAFERFQAERNISWSDGFFQYPKCYLAVADADNDRYVIIMEDVKYASYQLIDIRKMVDFDTTSVLVATLGRLHGLSLALRDQKPEIFEELLQIPDIFCKIMDPGLVRLIMWTLNEAIKHVTRDDEKQFLRKLKSDFPETLKNLFAKSAVSQFGALIHGDCWTNNFCVRSDSNVSWPKIIPETVIHIDRGKLQMV